MIKYLIFLSLITFKSYSLIYEEIDALTVNGSLGQLIQRWNPLAQCSVSPKLSEDDVRSKYERLACTPTKPTFPELQKELADWKVELRAEEDARLAEIARRQRFKDDFKKVPDLRLAMGECGYKDANIKIFVKKVIDDDDKSKLNCLKSKINMIKDKISEQNNKQKLFKEDCKQLKLDTSLPGFAKRILLRLCK